MSEVNLIWVHVGLLGRGDINADITSTAAILNELPHRPQMNEEPS